MSNIKELILGLCPDGVSQWQLGDLEDKGFIKLGRGNVISKKDIEKIPGDFPVYSSSAAGVGEFGRYGEYMFDDERISWSVDGGGRFFYRPAHKYSITNVSGWLKVNDADKINTKYLFHALDNAWASKKYDYTKKAHPSVIRNEYTIPLPPLKIQDEIVRLLEPFTQLETLLVEELGSRQSQYDYYLRKFINSVAEEAEEYKLGDIVQFTNGKAHEKDIDPNGAYTVVNSKFISTNGQVAKFSAEQICPVNKDDVLMVMSDLPNGKALAKCFYVEEDDKFTLNQRICSLRPLDSKKLNPKYLFYILNRNNQLLRFNNGVDQTNLKKDDVLSTKIAIPSLHEQDHLVAVLDNFYKLIHDSNQGLPAEISTRRKQYEYYRAKLLTFQELSA